MRGREGERERKRENLAMWNGSAWRYISMPTGMFMCAGKGLYMCA